MLLLVLVGGDKAHYTGDWSAQRVPMPTSPSSLRCLVRVQHCNTHGTSQRTLYNTLSFTQAL
jgi:hypothetical protein